MSSPQVIPPVVGIPREVVKKMERRRADGKTAHASSQRGPSSAFRTGKAKRIALQQARQQRRERDFDAIFDAAPRLPKVVQARCYIHREQRGGLARVRLKLSIDRSMCAAPVVLTARTTLDGSSTTRAPESAAQRAGRQLSLRACALEAKFSSLAKLKSAGEVERAWVWAINSTVQLVEALRGWTHTEGPPECPWLFGLVQQALQTGPLCFGKPAQFRRLAKQLQLHQSGQIASDHPHTRAVRRLLDAMLRLVPPQTTAWAMEAQAAAAAIAAEEIDDPSLPIELELSVRDVPSPASVVGSPAAEGARIEAHTEQAAQAAAAPPHPALLSSKQCNVVRGWDADFERSFGCESQRGTRSVGGQHSANEPRTANTISPTSSGPGIGSGNATRADGV